jgi:hypothetical protein
MTGGFSLVLPFANLIVEMLLKRRLPDPLLLVVAAICFAYASYRVWRAEHRRRLVLPLVILLESVELLRKHWKKHEHDFGKIGTPYFPASGTPEFSYWTPANCYEYRDKSQLSSEIIRCAQNLRLAYDSLSDTNYPQFVKTMTGPMGSSVNGQQLDEMLRDLDRDLIRKIREIGRKGARPSYVARLDERISIGDIGS